MRLRTSRQQTQRLEKIISTDTNNYTEQHCDQSQRYSGYVRLFILLRPKLILFYIFLFVCLGGLESDRITLQPVYCLSSIINICSIKV